MKQVTLLIILVFVISCSSVKKLAINQSADLFAQASQGVSLESDYVIFKESTLPNLKTLEGIHFAAPENETIVSLLIKGYTGYGFAIVETENFEDLILESEESKGVRHLKSAYTRAIDYGIKYFELKGIKREELFSRAGSERVEEVFSDDLDENDKAALFYTAQALAGIVTLDKQNMYLLTTASTLKTMVDMVCNNDPKYENGACLLFYGAYESSRPKMMGGGHEKGKKYFEKVLKKYPENLLNQLSYLQYYLIPTQKSLEVNRLLVELEEKFEDFQRKNNFGQSIKKKSSLDDKFNLFNAIAFERFKKLKKLKKKLL